MYLAKVNQSPYKAAHRPHFRRRRTLGSGSQIATTGISSAAGSGASYGATAALTAAGVGSGAVIGTVVPVVGTIVGALIGGLLSGHFARKKGAQTENAQLNQVMPAVISDISSIFDAANKGQISAGDAINALQAVQSNFWQAMAPYETGPGQAGGPSKCTPWTDTSPGTQTDGSKNPTPCTKSCTASCCVGCNIVGQWVYRATRIFQNNGQDPTTLKKWLPLVGNKYGLSNFTPPNWTYTPPAGGVSSASSAIASVTSATVMGIPLWLLGMAGLLVFLL